MSLSFNAFNHKEWASYNLADYGDYSDKTTDINQRDDGPDSTAGTWFYIPDEPLVVEGQGTFRVIYSGTWGNYNSPGADSYTNAELYDIEDADDMAAFEKDSKRLDDAPEWLETDDGDEDEDSDEDDEMDDEAEHDEMHRLADVVSERLKGSLTATALEGMDCDDVLMAGKEWLGEDDADVKALADAIRVYDEK